MVITEKVASGGEGRRFRKIKKNIFMKVVEKQAERDFHHEFSSSIRIGVGVPSQRV